MSIYTNIYRYIQHVEVNAKTADKFCDSHMDLSRLAFMINEMLQSISVG